MEWQETTEETPEEETPAVEDEPKVVEVIEEEVEGVDEPEDVVEGESDKYGI